MSISQIHQNHKSLESTAVEYQHSPLKLFATEVHLCMGYRPQPIVLDITLRDLPVHNSFLFCPTILLSAAFCTHLVVQKL